MTDYILCSIQARHAEQRRRMACKLLSDALLLPLYEDGSFLDMFQAIYGSLVVNRHYTLRTRVVIDFRFSVRYDD